jgi:hypothetical protein
LVEGKRDSLLRFLRQRFTSRLPKAIATRITAELDSATLDTWLDQVAKANTLAEFRQVTGL